MPEIKVKSVAKGTVKTIDKSAVAARHMQNAFVRTKEISGRNDMPPDESPETFASGCVSDGAHTVARKAVHHLDRQGRKGLKNTGDIIGKAKDRWGKHTTDSAKERTQHQTAANMVHSKIKVKTKAAAQSEKAAKQTLKSAKESVKSTRTTIKTADQTAKCTIRTARQTAKNAQRTAQAGARTAKAAVQTAVHAVKTAAKGTVNAVKGILAAAKGLLAALAAGGWIAVVVILVICMAAFLVGSCFSIFFGSADSGPAQSLQQVAAELNGEYMAQIDAIKTNLQYDVLEMSGAQAEWQQVLAVYAVKVTANPKEPQQVATIDDSKKAVLTDIFWQMNVIASRTENKTEEIVRTTTDSNGNIVEITETVTRTYLYITQSGKTADEMATQLAFGEKQRGQLAELLDERYTQYWDTLIRGIG